MSKPHIRNTGSKKFRFRFRFHLNLVFFCNLVTLHLCERLQKCLDVAKNVKMLKFEGKAQTKSKCWTKQNKFKKWSKIRLKQKNFDSLTLAYFLTVIPEVFFLAWRPGPNYVSTQFLDISNFSQDLRIIRIISSTWY